MVGPSLSDDERDLANARLKLGFVLMVGFSAGLIALQGDASLPAVALVTGVGAVFGFVLLKYLVWISR